MTPPAHPRTPDPLLQKRLAQWSRQRRRVRRCAMLFLGLAALAGGIVWCVRSFVGSSLPHQANKPTNPQTNKEAASGSAPSASRPSVPLGPLDLRYIPAGAMMLAGLRPADLLASPAGREILLGLESWAGRQRVEPVVRGSPDPAPQAPAPLVRRLEAFGLVAAGDIDHVVLAWIPAVDGGPPRVSAVVDLRAPLDQNDLKRRLPNAEERLVELSASGDGVPDASRPARQVTVLAAPGSRWAYGLVDRRTLLVFPPELAAAVLDVKSGHAAHRYLQPLLARSSTERHFTLILDTAFLRAEAQQLLAPDLAERLRPALEWLHDAGPAAMFSFHTADTASLELVIARGERSLDALAGMLDERLQRGPYELREAMTRWPPPRRGRRLVARFPAMVKALAVQTTFFPEGRVLVGRAVLPERAGPNFAWAVPLAMEHWLAQPSTPKADHPP